MPKLEKVDAREKAIELLTDAWLTWFGTPPRRLTEAQAEELVVRLENDGLVIARKEPASE